MTEIYTIEDDKTASAEELANQINRLDKKIAEDEKKRNKVSVEDSASMFRAAYFICRGGSGPGSGRGVLIPRSDMFAIEEHRRNCPACQEYLKEEREALLLPTEGEKSLNGILSMMFSCKDDLEYGKKREREANEKRAKGEWTDEQEYKLALFLTENDKARGMLRKNMRLLEELMHHENKIIRDAARRSFLQDWNRKSLQELDDFIKKDLWNAEEGFLSSALAAATATTTVGKS